MRHDVEAPRRDYLFCSSHVDDAFWSHDRGCTVASLLEKASRVTGYTAEQLKARRGKAPLVQARFALWLAARRRTGKSYPVLAKLLNRDDHTTIHHGCCRAIEMERTDSNFARVVREIAA